MIRVDVEDYCNQCLDFHPDMIPATKVRSLDNDETTISDTLIKCEYRKRCAAIYRFLEQYLKKEACG